eukprot:gene21370-22219_t
MASATGKRAENPRYAAPGASGRMSGSGRGGAGHSASSRLIDALAAVNAVTQIRRNGGMAMVCGCKMNFQLRRSDISRSSGHWRCPAGAGYPCPAVAAGKAFSRFREGRVSATIEGLPTDPLESVEIRVRGRVQGVGFRPTVWRLANDLGLAGEVLNDNEGVLIRARGSRMQLDGLIGALTRSPPPLAEITAIEARACPDLLAAGFTIRDSASGTARTEIAPDAATCPACTAEVLDPTARRYRYPFTNCTHCGPRLSIVRRVPYDRATTTMAPFPLCEPCLGEYSDPADPRFHAEATACPNCGPTARLIRFDGADVAGGGDPAPDAIDRARRLIAAGEIVAIKAIGGYQLACDAACAEAVTRLRRLKRRDAKPFALMAADLDVIRRY